MRKLFTLFSCLLFSGFILKAQVQNKALSFSGISASNATFGDINALDGTSKFTFEAWIYINEWKNNSYIFIKEGDTWNHKISMQLGYKPDAVTKRIFFHVANGENTYAAVDAPAITVGKWHHIAVGYDGNASQGQFIDVFIDGILANEWYSKGAVQNQLPSVTPSGSGSFTLGAGGFSGKIDEVRLWNIKLTTAQLDYKNTINSYHPLYNNLIAYWKMDQGEAAIKDAKGIFNGIFNNTSLVPVTDNTALVYNIVSSYVRSNFYETGRISKEALLNNNDIVYLAANTYADGEVFFEYPENHGTLTNASYLASFEGRNGVLDLKGAGAVMNAGKDLLNKPDAGSNSFSFSSWIYIDNWIENSSIFRKYNTANSRIDLQFGTQSSSTLNFYLANGANSYVQINNSGLTPGQWHHVAVTYTGGATANNQVKIYIDGVNKSGVVYSGSDGLLSRTGPFIRSDFELGINFDGKMDETSVNILSLGAGEIANIMNNPLVFNSWNVSKTVAYWKYDDAAKPGHDSRTWKNVLDKLKQDIEGTTGAYLRLGFSGGDWRKMMQTATSRNNFAQNVKNVLIANSFDGLDLDFEWCETAQEWTNYSLTIEALKAALGDDFLFSVTLHPLYYKISTAAANSLDFISIQSYGPSPERFPYDEFVRNVNAMLAYGFPKNKLVMGLPFYGSTAKKSTTAYLDILKIFPNLDPALDQVSMTLNNEVQTVIFNGQQTVINKTKFVRDQNLAGVMYWDISTDIDVVQPLSLLRAMNSVMNANVELVTDEEGTLPVKFTSFTAKQVNNQINLNWSTASENNSLEFIVERSEDGLDFSAIGTVKAAGNSSASLIYNYRDLYPVNGTAYYRLKQVDLNNEFIYSATKSFNLNLQNQEIVSVFPNPASSYLTIGGVLNNPKEIRLFNLSGVEILRLHRPEKQIAIPASVNSGTYILVIVYTDDRISQHKISISK